MKQIKYFIRMTATSWILYDILKLMGMSHEMGMLFTLPIWLLLLTLYDDVEVSRETKKTQVKY